MSVRSIILGKHKFLLTQQSKSLHFPLLRIIKRSYTNRNILKLQERGFWEDRFPEKWYSILQSFF